MCKSPVCGDSTGLKKILQGGKMIKPARMVIAIDKLTKRMFDCTKKIGGSRELDEGFKKVKTTFEVRNLHEPLNLFDELIYSACISEKAAGGKMTTPRRIYHLIGGGHILTAEMEKKIKNSIEKMAACHISVDAYDLVDYYGDKLRYSGALLPMEKVQAEIKGRIYEVYQFIGDSPLFEITELKKQLISLKFELMEIEKYRNSETGLKLKFYLLKRILVIKGSKRKKWEKGLNKSILFETLYTDLNIPSTERKRKQDIRQSAEKIMKHLQDQGVIKSYQFEKEKGSYRAITFSC